MRKKLLYLLCLMGILFLIPPKALAAYQVKGWCEWQGTGADYNKHCPKDCRLQGDEGSCNAVVMNNNSGTKCCRWVPNNILETSATSPDDRSYTATLEATSKPLVFKPSVGLPGFPKDIKYVFQDDSTSPIAKLMAEIYKYAIQIIAVLSLIVVIIGGFLWSTAGGSAQKVTGAKQWIFSGLGGLLLTLFSYLLLATININLVNLKTTSIGAIHTKDLIVTNKSDKNQLYDDCSMFDGYFANANLVAYNGSPILEACCFVYNKNSLTDKAYGVSYTYIPTMLYNLYDECIKYAIAKTNKNLLSDFYSGMRKDVTTACDTCYISNIFTSNASTISGSKFIYMPSNYILNNPDLKPTNMTAEEIENYSKDATIILITDKACWDLDGFIRSVTQGKDVGNYCQGKSNYSTCLLKDPQNPDKRLWGYCWNNTCQQCKTYGEASDSPYKCPLSKTIQGNNNCVSNFKCGLDSWVGSVGIIDSGYCQCNISQCMDTCYATMKAANVENKRIKDVCEG